MKKQFIRDLHPEDNVDSVFYVYDKEVRKTREGKDYLRLTLRDKTGSITAVFFDPGSAKNIPKGSFARVTGTVSDYKGQLNIKLDDLWEEKEDAIDYEDFLPSTSRDVEGCYTKLAETARSLKEPLASLLTAFYDNALFARQFKLAPGGVTVHHGYLGGLCVHTYDMLAIASDVCKRDESLDRDLLYAGVLLHDIGKIREYAYTRNIDSTEEGRFLGHITIGIRMVEREIARISDFPERLAWKLEHMIISHHGEREYGSPILPKFIEAQILHHIDNMDAKRAIYKEMAQANSSEKWSEYNPYLGHEIYFERE